MKTIECWLVIIGVVILASSEEATIKAAGCDKLCRERQTFLNPTETGAKKYRFYNDSICQWCTRTNSLCKPQSTDSKTDHSCLVPSGQAGTMKYWKVTATTVCDHPQGSWVEADNVESDGDFLMDDPTKCIDPGTLPGEG